ncbi:ATP-dependent DNA helicase RecG [Anaerofustis stercorihominis]|uniref:ATP-dependent DNA helicase RecG n=1 Tax=Anaerofustis stercorihominis TaxID=214853 RepID=UPI00214C28FD|nr:ATP-dependent DNA helicase RecG [Anaerofustis stercorihominis]MCR2032440.1 ATP-dependent DNA helicase RecG [Anaerofustis stercorihominis]
MSCKLSDLKGVGEKKEQALNSMGIYTLEDLLDYYPRTYEVVGDITSINKVRPGTKALVKCTFLEALKTRIVRKNLKITKIKFLSEGSIFYATFFNNPYISSYFKKDTSYKLYGKVEKNGNYFEMVSPKYSKLEDNVSIKNGLNPVYPLSTKNKLTNKDFKNFISSALCKADIIDYIPFEIKREYGLISLSDAYKNIHIPNSLEDTLKANERMTFDEFCGFNLSIILNKNLNLGKKGEIFEIINKNKFMELIPFELTPSQNKVITEIEEDLISGVKMNRLVQGDVGSGKTVVALYAVYLTVLNGCQAAFCAPTKILAMQHYQSIKEIFDKLDVKVELLHSKMTAKEKREAYERIECGESKIIVGTHAVFSSKVKYNNLGLAVIDEQHRFGVAQRGFLDKKGESVHTLVMSATPIPRTLMLSIYKDLDVSIIDKKPGGRKEIKTYYKDYSYYDRIYRFALKEIAKNNQVYIVCPSIDSDDLEAAEKTYKKLKKTYFKNVNAALIHGKMDEDEKEKIMEDFYNGAISALIATSVIEVGIDSKNATLIIIEGADRFGLASLHQLRGRVGRNNKDSYCILLSENPSKKSIERLNFLSKNNDGFEIALFDLKTRGSGDILGYRQSGKGGYNIYKLIENSELFNKSKTAMDKILNDDNEVNRNYLKYIKNKYDNVTKDITWN